MTPSENENSTSTGTQVSPESIAFLVAGAKWARFIAIMGFIGCAIMMIAGFVAIVKGMGDDYHVSDYPAYTYGREYEYRAPEFPVWLFGFGYFIGAVLWYLPSKFLNNFALQSIQAGNTGSAKQVQDCLENLFKYFRFNGILMILAVAGFVLLILVTTATFTGGV